MQMHVKKDIKAKKSKAFLEVRKIKQNKRDSPDCPPVHDTGTDRQAYANYSFGQGCLSTCCDLHHPSSEPGQEWKESWVSTRSKLKHKQQNCVIKKKIRCNIADVFKTQDDFDIFLEK